jgi:hypothetical protein
LIEFLSDETPKYFANQKRVVENSVNLAKKIELCEKCNTPKQGVCACNGRQDKPILGDDPDTQKWCHRVAKQVQQKKEAFDFSQGQLYLEDNDGRLHVRKFIHYNPDGTPYFTTKSKSCEVTMPFSRAHKFHQPPNAQKIPTEHAITGEDMIPEIGQVFAWAMYPFYAKYTTLALKCWSKFWVGAEAYTTQWCLDQLEWLETSPFAVWTNWLPKAWIEHPYFRDFIFWSNQKEINRRVRQSVICHVTSATLCLCTALYSWHARTCTGPSIWIVPQDFTCYSMFFLANPWNLSIVWFPLPTLLVCFVCVTIATINLLSVAVLAQFHKRRLYDALHREHSRMPDFFKYYRDHHAKWLINTSALILAVYGLVQVWKASKIIIKAMDKEPEGNLAPTTDGDIEKRDTEVNPWASVRISAMPCSDKSKTITPDQLEERAFANLCYMEIENLKTGKKHHCDAFFPRSNIAIIPQHSWVHTDLKATFTRHNPQFIGGNFECYLYQKHSVHIPGTDLSLVWIPNGGDWKDLTDYLPLAAYGQVPARLVYKDSEGGKRVSRFATRVLMTGHRDAQFLGCEYDLEWDHFNGLCMSPIITETKGPTIGAFHLGGSASNGRRGCAGLLTRKQFDQAYDELRLLPGLIVSKSSGTLPTEMYDVQFYQGDTVHPKSPVNYLPLGSNCKFYGQVTGRATYHSTVRTTIISDHVKDVCGIPQQWAGPKFRKGWPWQASLQYSTRPSCGVEGSLLVLAVNDYRDHMIEQLDRFPSLRRKVTPLSEMDTVCGQDGVRFIDKMPAGTSVGFPLSGPKKNFLEELDPQEHTSHQFPCRLDERFWTHAKELEELYLQGERAYPIFKACMKDEPTKITKDKVRIFQGAPLVLQLLVRRYYLPIVRVLSMLPLESECAVGVNAQGPEWDQLARFITKYGEDRILAGDYGKYDLRMPAQVMFAAFRILIDLGKHCGYSERDVAIMEGIATDICYPLMAYNGDLIQHFGSNPSGQNLTVYINSIVNSLLFRCAYFKIYEGRRVPKFRDVCALMTYGDDAKSSVKAGYSEFNHIAVAKFLSDRDMVFTMPDKTSTPTPYMSDADADFLKRKNVFSPDTNMIMGALDEGSIFKSLHATMESSAITKQQAAAFNIDGGLREWFNHGRSVYELRREQMQEVAKRADIAHICTLLDRSYDEALSVWKDTYLSKEQEAS